MARNVLALIAGKQRAKFMCMTIEMCGDLKYAAKRTSDTRNMHVNEMHMFAMRYHYVIGVQKEK